MYKYAALTHQGKIRENNEDNFYINDKWKKKTEEAAYAVDGEMTGNRLLSAVFDGMGGEELGEVASLSATESMHELFGADDILEEKKPDEDNSSRIKRIFQKKKKTTYEPAADEPVISRHAKSFQLLQTDPMSYVTYANKKICEEIEKRQTSMGTTFTCIEFYDGCATSINIGDSPAYLYRDGSLTQLSVEHSPIGSLIRDGLITREEAKTHPLRNKISQYFGISPDVMELVPAVSDRIPLKIGDQYLICSDGLSNMVSPEEITNILTQAIEVKEKVRLLVQAAIDRGGKDNITVIIVEIG